MLLAAAWLFVAPVASAQPADDTYKAGQFDNGKMWTFDFPPLSNLHACTDNRSCRRWDSNPHIPKDTGS